MKQVQDSAAIFFIICVLVLSVISILGIWKILNTDVITKSFSSIGVLAVAAVITIISGKFIDARKSETSSDGTPINTMQSVPNPIFTSFRHVTLFLLIASVSLLALFGIMAIWEIMSGEVLSKSLSSMGVLAFSSMVIVMTCLERENHPLLKSRTQNRSPVTIIFLIILGLILLSYIFQFFMMVPPKLYR